MLLKLKVKPASEKTIIKVETGLKGSVVKIWLKSPAKDGKANKELSLLLNKVFGSYKFVSGRISREKLIKVDMDIDNVFDRIRKFTKRT